MRASVQISRGIESLFGTRDENIRLIESGFRINTHLVDNSLEIEGEPNDVARAENVSGRVRGAGPRGSCFQ